MSVAEADSHYMVEEYQKAIAIYDTVLSKYDESEVPVPLVHLRRARALMGCKKYQDALEDLVQFLSLYEDTTGVGLRLKGECEFYLSQFQGASESFEASTARGQDCELWKRRCACHIKTKQTNKSENSEEPIADSVDKTSPTTSSSSSAAAPVAAPVAAPSPAPSPAPVAAASAPPRPVYREDWYQTNGNVYITLFAKNLNPSEVNVSFAGDSVHMEATLPNGHPYTKTWSLFGKIEDGSGSFKVTPYKVEVSMKKADALLDWDCLEKVTTDTSDADGTLPVKRPNEVSGTRVAYPYSGKKIEWGKVEQEVEKEEEEAKPEGDAALMKLFQTIYKDADDDTRRAMMKSYQTSGGTVLSTNWKEVAQKDYEKEIVPPKGQELYKPPI